MPAADLALQVNLFPIEFSADAVSLPRRNFRDQEAASRYLESLPRAISAIRGAAEERGVPVFLFGLPREDFDFPSVEEIELSKNPELAKKLIDNATRDFFANRGMLVRRDFQGSIVLQPGPIIERGDVLIRQGVAVHARRPFANDPTFFVLAASWQTKAEFKESLANDILRSMAVGQSVLYRPPKSVRVDKELKKKINRHIGSVLQVHASGEAVVQCVDHSTRLLPSEHLYLEAGPSTLNEYDRRAGNRGSSLWNELLKANFTLTSMGRRNTRVLRDRLAAVQRFLGARGETALELAVPFCDRLKVHVDLRPITATYT